MQLYQGSDSAARELEGPAVAIGNFDGVHLGHRALFEHAVNLAHLRGSRAAVLTFSPHPARYFDPELAPPLITTREQKLRQIESCGVDVLVEETFDSDFASLWPRAFVEQVLVQKLHVRDVIVGAGFVFGRKRAGDVETLQRLGEEFGFEAHGIAPVRAGAIIVSSTKIREFILLGRVFGAAGLLGRAYAITGVVVTGAGRGRTIGVPTANVEPDNEILPARGVYAGWATTGASHRSAAVINIGHAPTFRDDHKLKVEAHLLDFSGDLVGQRIDVEFIKRLREERRFDSADELVQAIRGDIAAARELLELPDEG